MQLNELSRTRIAMYDSHSQWGHTGILGKSGYGKGTCGQTLCEQAHIKGHKVLVWDMFRAENVFYGMPEDNQEMLRRIYATGRKPRGFKTEILCPIFAKGKDQQEYKMPENWTPVKISYGNLTTSELKYLMGDTSSKAEQILDAIDFSQFKTLADLQVKFLQLQSGDDQLLVISPNGDTADIGDKRIYRTINRAIGSLIKKNIVCSTLPEGFEFIDIKKIQENSDVITAITGRFSGNVENFLTFFFNVMSQLIYSRQKDSGKYAPMTIYIPEVSNIAGATEHDTAVRNLLRFILQEARDSGISVLIDTQKPQNIDASVKAQITKWYVFNLNKDDVDYIDKNLFDVPRDYDIFWEIPRQGVGTCVKVWQDRSYRWCFGKAVKMFVPLSHKKQAYEDVNKFFVDRGFGLKSVVDSGYGDGIKTGFASGLGVEEFDGDSESVKDDLEEFRL